MKGVNQVIQTPMDVLHQFPVRKTKRQKQEFRTGVETYVRTLGYETRVEEGAFGCRNLVIGDPERANCLVTAHYDTCARMVIPNFVTPCNVPVYLGYQILILVGLLAIAAAMGVAAGFVWPKAASLIGMISFLLLLLLMILGPANPTNANDNTSGVVTLLEIARTMPENQRHKVCFVLFDLEEAGLIGSASYRKAHGKCVNRQLVLNLDCVGDGDEMRIFPTKALLKDRVKLTSLYKACGYFGKKNLLVQEKGRFIYPSDQILFPYGAGICALRKRKKQLYLSRIHTKEDTILDETNVNILRAALTTFICRDAVQ